MKLAPKSFKTPTENNKQAISKTINGSSIYLYNLSDDHDEQESKIHTESTTKTLFTYEEIALQLSNYICSKKNRIFDPRNPRLALVAEDPIGIAFGVKGFHRCQIGNLLKYQLIPVKENTESDTTSRNFKENPTLSLKSAEKLSKTPELSHGIHSREEHNPTPNAEYNEHDKLLTLPSSNLTSGSETLFSKDLSINVKKTMRCAW